MLTGKEHIEGLLHCRDQKLFTSLGSEKYIIRKHKAFFADNQSAVNILFDTYSENIISNSTHKSEYRLITACFSKELINFLREADCKDKDLFNIYISGSGNTILAYPVSGEGDCFIQKFRRTDKQFEEWNHIDSYDGIDHDLLVEEGSILSFDKVEI